MKILKIFVASSLFLMFVNCQEKTSIVLPKGNIVGFVYLFNQNNERLSDESGTQVSILNTNYKVFTNEIGRFEFKEIPAGTYDFIFEKEGFTSVTKTGFQFVGGNVPAYLYEQYLYIEAEN